MQAGSYLVELERWQIKNDATDAVQTSKGINDALIWASQQGFTEVVLPKGTYLIDENNPVQPLSNMTLNLGGATLQIRSNKQPKYSIVLFQKNQFSRITNGKLVGDRHSHDYSSGGTHEFGVGVELRHGVEYITIDNLDISGTTGDAIFGITSFGGIGGDFPKLAGNMEVGGINTSNGTLTSETNRIRSIVNIPMVPQIVHTGYFGLYGDSYGGIGNEITSNTYDVVFYKSDDTFLIATTDRHFFDEIEVPTGAAYAKVVLHQSTIPSVKGNAITIRTPQFPKHIYIEKCNLHHCRRLGIAICGMKHCYVRGCEIHHISGTAPQGAIDIEDGYDINQYIYLDGNNIYDNKSYNIIAVAGRHINITNNKIRGSIFTLNDGVDKAVVDNNHFVNCGPRLTGEIVFTNNHLYHSRTRLNGSGEVIVDNCLFHNSPINIEKNKPNVSHVNNCRFLFDNDFANDSINPGSPLIFGSEPQTISNSTFKGSGKEAFTSVISGAHNWLLENVTFENIKHQGDRVTQLAPGVYNGCKFIHCGRLSLSQNTPKGSYDLINCYFEWDTRPLFYIGQEIKSDFFKISNSHFINSIDSTPAFFMLGEWKDIILSNNVLRYLNGNNQSIIDIRSSIAVSGTVLVKENSFLSKGKMTAISASSAIPIIFIDNYLNNVSVKLQENHLTKDNIDK